MKKIIVLAVLAALVAAGFYYGGEYANLAFVKQQQSAVTDYYDKNPALLLGGFFVAYVAVTGLSLPGAALMTLLAGAIFGVLAGTILVSFASSIGATLAFLVARFLLGESLQKKYGDKLQKINDGVKREGKVLPLHHAADSRLSVLSHQHPDGADPHSGAGVLLGQPVGNAGGNRCLCKRRNATGEN